MQTITWTIKGGRLLGPAPFFVMGVVNATPDSFFDGGTHQTTDAGVAHGLQLVADGAHILDVGGESSRPFAEPVTEAQEQERVLGVVRGLSHALENSASVISVDTYRASTAQKSLEAGASIINDISGCLFDPELADVVAQYAPGYVLMHSQGKPTDMQVAPVYDNVLDEVEAFFTERMNMLVQKGLPEDRIVLDPGIGFGKTLEHNLALLRGIDRFVQMGKPVLMGLSNKSLFGDLLGLAVDERYNATQAATAVLASRNIGIHRVHDVKHTVQTITVAQALTEG